MVKTFQVGYGEDWTGATRKYLIKGQTLDGRYKVTPFDIITRLDGSQYLAEERARLLIVSKLVEIHEESI